MNKRLKRYITKCTILLLMSAIVALTGCGSDAQADFSGIVENAEDDGGNVSCDEAVTPEPKALNDSDKPETDSENGTEADLNPMEIYEGFLEGDIMIEKEEEQVSIDELFWDNDMEYCFADIDGDGSEELHIRDSQFHYTIKIKDEKPQIVFESWRDNELGGNLFDDCEYGNEPEWTSRRLKNFTTWKEAYIDFVNKLHVTVGYDRGGCEYSLIYVDDNDIVYYEYFWEGKEVTEAEYMAHINELIDTSKCIEPPFVCSKAEILEMLEE